MNYLVPLQALLILGAVRVVQEFALTLTWSRSHPWSLSHSHPHIYSHPGSHPHSRAHSQPRLEFCLLSSLIDGDNLLHCNLYNF